MLNISLGKDAHFAALHCNRSAAINAIKFYFESVLNRPLEPFVIQRPKKEKKLPTVLSEEEVARILKQIRNLKHRCVIYLMYSAGLRRSEVLNLKPTDIDSQRNCIIVRNGKGKKDRMTLLSDKALISTREYYRQYRPKIWLFEGANGGKYSITSVRKIFQRALAQSGVRKEVTLHSLRQLCDPFAGEGYGSEIYPSAAGAFTPLD